MRTGRFPGAEEEDDETLSDAESGTGGAGGVEDVCEEDEDDPTDGVVSGSDQPPSPSSTEGAERRARSTAMPRGKGSGASAASKLRLPQHWNKFSSLIWRGVEGVVSELFKKLRDNYKRAKGMEDKIRETRTVPDTRTLTLKQIEEALGDSGGGRGFRDAVDKLEKFDYKLYGIKVPCESKLV